MKSSMAATGLEPVPPNVRAVCFPLHHAALSAYYLCGMQAHDKKYKNRDVTHAICPMANPCITFDRYTGYIFYIRRNKYWTYRIYIQN